MGTPSRAPTQTPTSEGTATPSESPTPAFSSGKCGGAIGGVDGKSCQEALWGPCGDSSMPCFEYGKACTLNCYASSGDTNKDPSNCNNGQNMFYLWDEPDTHYSACGATSKRGTRTDGLARLGWPTPTD